MNLDVEAKIEEIEGLTPGGCQPFHSIFARAEWETTQDGFFPKEFLAFLASQSLKNEALTTSIPDSMGAELQSKNL